MINTSNMTSIDTKRKTAIAIGSGLLLMAALSAIAFPHLGTLTASLALIGIFLLDLLISLGIYRYHNNDDPKLSKVSSALRLIYTAIFGIGIGSHISGDVSKFNMIWGIGLIVFGVHLVTLGVLSDRNKRPRGVTTLIKLLLIVAGIGYVTEYAGMLVVSYPAVFAALMQKIFVIPMVSGEIFYALWMLIKGGKTT